MKQSGLVQPNAKVEDSGEPEPKWSSTPPPYNGTGGAHPHAGTCTLHW